MAKKPSKREITDAEENNNISVAVRECIADMLQALQERLVVHTPFSAHVGGTAETNQANQHNIPTVLNQVIVEELNASTCSSAGTVLESSPAKIGYFGKNADSSVLVRKMNMTNSSLLAMILMESYLLSIRVS